MSTPCCRCNGDGIIPAFKHICRGICFRCWGAGTAPRDALEALQAARAAYRRAWSRRESERTLAAIAAEGKRLRAAWESAVAWAKVGKATARQAALAV